MSKSAVLLRFEPGQLDAIDRAAQAAGLSRTAYLRARAEGLLRGQEWTSVDAGHGFVAVPLPAEVAHELIAFARAMQESTSGGRFELHFSAGGTLAHWKAERGGKVGAERRQSPR